MFRRRLIPVLMLLVVLGVSIPLTLADDIPPATIVNDEGGAVSITGTLTYTNGFFTAGVDEPVIILEDEAGFVDRNHGFIMSEKSQVFAKLTSDFYSSPVSYSLDLPAVPQADLRDVDEDGQTDTGVMIYGVAFWQNIWGDQYLEERDLFGGGWSGAYASFKIDPSPSAKGEVTGGKYLVYAPDDQQGFPSGFGDDHKLFTADDPIVRLPQGYTVVNMDTAPFTFDRSSHPVIDLIEGQGAEQEDFSNLNYVDAFKAMVDMFRKKYAFTDLKHIDWDAKEAEFLPRFEDAQKNNDSAAYQLALRDFIWSIPDGHLSAPVDGQQFNDAVAGGLGLSLTELDDGRVIVAYLTPGGPAEQAGMKLGTQILGIDGKPIEKAISDVVPWSSPFSSEHVRRLQQVRYVVRFPLGTDVTLKYQNPDSTTTQSATLATVSETDSFNYSSFNRGLTGNEPPVAFRILDNGYGYVNIYSFFDSAHQTIQLWEEMIKTLRDQNVPGLIIDMRHNGGGSGFLADQMAAYFYNEPLKLGNGASYDESQGGFYSDPNVEAHYILPPEDMRYNGKIALLVGPGCFSACEFFSYNMTLQNRAAIVGQYPTGGLGGGQTTYAMPDGLQLQYSVVRPLDSQGNIIIEGTGVVPTVKVPVDETTVFSQDDVVLESFSVGEWSQTLPFNVYSHPRFPLSFHRQKQVIRLTILSDRNILIVSIEAIYSSRRSETDVE